MEDKNNKEQSVPTAGRGMRPVFVILIVIAAVVLTAEASWWLYGHYLFPKEFKPVELAPHEERILENKMRAMGIEGTAQDSEESPLEPEPYNEAGSTREITLTERELNAMPAKNTDLARKPAIDLSDDLVSAKLLIPLEEDFPLLGGKTLRIHTGAELAFRNGRPVVVLKGVSVMGVPIPSAWPGNRKTWIWCRNSTTPRVSGKASPTAWSTSESKTAA